MSDGTVFNQGMSVQLGGPSYSIIKFPLEKKQGKANDEILVLYKTYFYKTIFRLLLKI